ncbi:MAG: hypothetical protein Ct9H300mP1_17380 [Planctomycetaceae bacterium]|nr:MAG: hypothetical protein Ct9H300mP1_17380 [Planctomycetaceae bacterium]
MTGKRSSSPRPRPSLYSGIFTKEIFTGDKAGEKIDFVIKARRWALRSLHRFAEHLSRSCRAA